MELQAVRCAPSSQDQAIPIFNPLYSAPSSVALGTPFAYFVALWPKVVAS